MMRDKINDDMIGNISCYLSLLLPIFKSQGIHIPRRPHAAESATLPLSRIAFLKT